MASVHLTSFEVEERLLPPICLRCGALATTYQQKNFQWNHWTALFIFCGLIPDFLGNSSTKAMIVQVPLCDRHKKHWFWRSFFIVVGLVLLFFAGLTGGVLLEDYKRVNREDMVDLVLLGIGAAGLVWLISVVTISYLVIRPTEVDERGITLTNVSAVFVEALVEERCLRREESKRTQKRRT